MTANVGALKKFRIYEKYRGNSVQRKRGEKGRKYKARAVLESFATCKNFARRRITSFSSAKFHVARFSRQEEKERERKRELASESREVDVRVKKDAENAEKVRPTAANF